MVTPATKYFCRNGYRHMIGRVETTMVAYFRPCLLYTSLTRASKSLQDKTYDSSVITYSYITFERNGIISVSYTHLDVYKRQVQIQP